MKIMPDTAMEGLTAKLHIPLENTPGSELIFKAEVINNEVIISKF